MIDQFQIGTDGRATIVKDPQAVLDYTFDWTGYLAGDTLVGVTFTSSAGSVVSTEIYTSMATAWLAGGAAGTTITLTCKIHTATGRIDACTAYIKVRER